MLTRQFYKNSILQVDYGLFFCEKGLTDKNSRKLGELAIDPE